MSIEKLIGKTIVKIEGESEILFSCNDGSKFEMKHFQDCCENVSVDKIVGNIEDILNEPVLSASETNPERLVDGLSDYDSFTWTDFSITTKKGTVIYQWLGVSNGYYSEEPEFIEIN